MDDTALANLALTRLGVDSILSIDDPTKAARLAKAYIGHARELVLLSYAWRAARARARLVAVATPDLVEDDEYQYAYDLPADCLQVHRLASGQDYMTEGSVLYTNDGNDLGPIAVYTKALATVDLPSHLVDVAALRLSIILAAHLGGEKYMVKLDQDAERAFREARAADARGGASLPPMPAKWTETS